jgi:YD repeat-containing protein
MAAMVWAHALADAPATATQSYDDAGRLTGATYSDGRSVQYAYDAAGNRQTVSLAVPTQTLQFAAGSYSVSENGGTVTLSVTRTGGTTGAVSVAYATSNGSAAAGTDYTATSGTLNWASGDGASKSFAVTILDDGASEGDETFTAALSNATGGAAIAGTNPVVVTIVDNESSVPSVPTNLRTQPVGTSFGGDFTVLWNASTGAVNHYTLREEITLGPGTGTVQTFAVTPPAVSKFFSKGTVERTFDYQVKACGTADETQCSAYTAVVEIATCPTFGCN